MADEEAGNTCTHMCTFRHMYEVKSIIPAALEDRALTCSCSFLFSVSR